MTVEIDAEYPWHLEWLWVSGYSTLATLVMVFNLLIMFSVGKNKYLHFSLHYAVIAMALRNILRVMQSCYLIGLAKLVQSHWLFKIVYQLPPQTIIKDDLTTASGMPITCQMHCTADIFLMSLVMFYIATLLVYTFCRPANPDHHNYKRSYINSEQCWVPTLVTLLPPLLSCLMCLPGPWLGAYHDMSALPRTTLCQSQLTESSTTYLASVAIIGFLLPLAIIIACTCALMIRRCVACARSRCCSSYTSEELALVLVSCVFTLTQLVMYLPTLDIYLASYGQPTTHSLIGDYVTPELARLGESVAGLVFPLIMFTVVPGYRRFRSVVDNHDVLDDDRDEKEYSEEPAHHGHVTRLSQESFDLQLVARNGHLHPHDDDDDRIYQ